MVSAWVDSVAGGGLLVRDPVSVCATFINLVPMQLQERRDEPPVRTDGALALEALRLARSTRSVAEPIVRVHRGEGDLLAQRAQRLAANGAPLDAPPS